MRKLIAKYLGEGAIPSGSSLNESRSLAMFVRGLDSLSVPRPMVVNQNAAAEMKDTFRLLDLLVRGALPLALKANGVPMPWFKTQEPIVYDNNLSASIAVLNRILARLDKLTEMLGDYDETAELDSLSSVADFIYEAIEDGIIPAIRLLRDEDDAPVRRMLRDATTSLANATNAAVYAGANEARLKRYVEAVIDNEPLFGDEII
jgi:hypothetical protein